MDCAAFQRWFSPYLDGLLPSAERAALEEHLKACARCPADLQSLTQMLAALRAMERPATPELLSGIHEKLQRQPWWRTAAERFFAPWPASLPWHGLALATSALLVVILVAMPSYRLKRSMRDADSYRNSFQVSQLPSQASQLSQQNRRAALKQTITARSLGEEADKEARAFGDRWSADGAVDEADKAATGVSAAPTAVPALPADGHLAGVYAGLERSDLADETQEELREAKAESSEPAPASRPDVLQVQWTVADVGSAAAQVTEWVTARQGWCVATNEHHLAVMLPSAEVPQFLQQFTDPPQADVQPSAAGWLSISLELLPPN